MCLHSEKCDITAEGYGSYYDFAINEPGAFGYYQALEEEYDISLMP